MMIHSKFLNWRVSKRFGNRVPHDGLVHLLIACVVLFSIRAFGDLVWTGSPGADDFVLSSGGKAVGIFVGADEHKAVGRAAQDLSEDINRVSGVKPQVVHNISVFPRPIIIGSLDKSGLLQQLVEAGKLDADRIKGQWESHVMQIVKHPLPGIESALIIAGSDRRGTIYGIYELSEMIGVSPWYWWADVPVKHRDVLGLRGDMRMQGPPAVKYRGIFLNDEDWGLRPWASKTFEPETGAIGPKTYAKIFELLLRLRANYLWPAMHPDTRAFNYFQTNKELAELYGIVMGSSHCEQMLRDNVDEWKPATNGEYNYVVNRDGVLKYWEKRVRENGKFESVYTLGMRGIHDSGMPGGGTAREKAARLGQIIQDQRDLLRKWVNPDVSAVPQIFCPYKEVLELYRLMPGLPDDVALVWPDDNYGYVREFSDARERQRAGGAGVYYHVSYWGRPSDYLWLCTQSPALIAEEMTKAFDYGANKVWILNVGDLKPAELDAEFFLKLAWNPHAWNGTNAIDLIERNLARDFGGQIAPELASILGEYYRLNFQRKPEHMAVSTNELFPSMLNGDEARQRLDAWQNLVARVDASERQLPPQSRDAFFELIGYPVRAAALMNEKWLALARFSAWQRQGRASAYDLLHEAQQAQRGIERLTGIYDNQIAGGKWRLMMSDHPRDQAAFKTPVQSTPGIPFAPARLGVAVEGDSRSSVMADTNAVFHLPEFSALTRRSHFVDVFNAGTAPLRWAATASEDWIKLDRASGEGDARVWVSIDWSNAPKGDEARGTIQFTAGEQKIPVEISVFNTSAGSNTRDADFVEDDGRIAIEAGHASARLPGTVAVWRIVSGLGYNGEAVSPFPALVPVLTEPRQIMSESPCLQYKIWMRHPGEWTVTLRTLPTFSVETGKSQRYAIAFDDDTPKIVSLPRATSETDRVWQANVLRNAAMTSTRMTVSTAGRHVLKIWMVDPGIVIDAIFAENGAASGLGYVGPMDTARIR